MGKFWNKWLFYALKHKNEGLRNEKERKGMKRNDIPESIGINRNQSENDREWPELRADYDRKRPETTAITSGLRPKMTENDRKRPQDLPSVLPLRGMDSSEIPRFSVHFPRKFPDFPRNSLIFPDFLRYSPNFFLTLRCFYIIIYIKVWKKILSQKKCAILSP